MINNYLYHIFDNAFEEIWNLVQSDSFIRFKHTRTFAMLRNHIYKEISLSSRHQSQNEPSKQENSIILRYDVDTALEGAKSRSNSLAGVEILTNDANFDNMINNMRSNTVRHVTDIKISRNRANSNAENCDNAENMETPPRKRAPETKESPLIAKDEHEREFVKIDFDAALPYLPEFKVPIDRNNTNSNDNNNNSKQHRSGNNEPNDECSDLSIFRATDMINLPRNSKSATATMKMNGNNNNNEEESQTCSNKESSVETLSTIRISIHRKSNENSFARHGSTESNEL